MTGLSPYDPQLIDFLRRELQVSGGAVMKQESTIKEEYPLRFDLVIDDGAKTYVIELRRVVRLADLAHPSLMKSLLTAGGISVTDIEFVIAGKRMTKEAEEAAGKTGIRLIKLPAAVGLTGSREKPGAVPVKLTSPKSWQVISHLLKMTGTSIRQLAIGSKVSYGWTHATIRALAAKGIVSDAGGYVKISDVGKLLNGIAWERPFERLLSREIRIHAENAVTLAQEICVVCEEERIPCAFTSFTAGAMYTGYSARHDTVYLYVEKKNTDPLIGLFDTESEGGITVRIYAPDRDVFADRRVFSVPGVWLVSPAQALLDCAGLGYGGRDLTMKLVEVYGGL